MSNLIWKIYILVNHRFPRTLSINPSFLLNTYDNIRRMKWKHKNDSWHFLCQISFRSLTESTETKYKQRDRHKRDRYVNFQMISSSPPLQNSFSKTICFDWNCMWRGNVFFVNYFTLAVLTISIVASLWCSFQLWSDCFPRKSIITVFFRTWMKSSWIARWT